MRDLTERDDLTGLASRRFILNELESRIKRGAVGLLLVDVDNFKSLNDQFGHLVGDAVLQSVSRTLLEAFGSWRHVGRIGGDEFLVWLEEKTESGLLKRIDAINEGLRHIAVSDLEDSPKVTVSIGAILIGRHENMKTAIEHADRALYEAKFLGRDTHVMARI